MRMNFREVVMRGARQQTTLPVNREAYPAAGWRRQTRTESRLLMELFPPLHLQFEQPFSYTPAYCSDRPLGSRVCRILIIAPCAGCEPGGSRENVASHGWTIPGRWVHNVCMFAPLGTWDGRSF